MFTSRFLQVFLILCKGGIYLVLSDAMFDIDEEKTVFKLNSRTTIPLNYDWRTRDMITPVKNQMHCGACWAFSIVAGIESYIKIKKNKNLVLSEQFLIDCIKGNGCQSASLLKSLAIIVVDIGGVLLDEDYYPYADQQQRCRWSPHRYSQRRPNFTLPNPFKNESPSKNLQSNAAPYPVVGFKRVLSDEDTIAEFVFYYGPVIAAINSASMARYTSGIDEPTDEQCDPTGLNHSVLIVGYNVYVSNASELSYWIIKNSWGTEWGDQGYYYLVRGRNACGIASDVSVAYVE